MNEVNTTALSERVNRLEHQNKLIKLTGIVVILGMALVLCCGAKEKVPKEIVAEKFTLVDTQGRTRALLYVDQDGPGLALYDEMKKSRVNLGIVQKGPALGLFDERGKPRANLSAGQDGPVLGLWDENGKPRAFLAVLQEGPSLSLWDKRGKSVFIAP